MKRITSAIFFLTIAVLNHAQTPKKTGIQFGETIHMTMKSYFFNMDIIGRDETGVYGIQMPAREVYGRTVGGIRNYQLARYNNNTLDNPELLELKLKEDGVERDYEFAAQVGNEVYIFSSFQNRKLRKTFLFTETVNKKQFGLNKDLRKIAEVDWSNESKYDRANFGFRFSRDKSKLLIRYSLVNGDNEVLRFGICAMDNHFQVLWQNDGALPVKPGAIFNFKRFYIDNKGDVYVVGILFKSEKELAKTSNMRKKSLLSRKRLVKREPNYVYQVISYTNKGKTVSDFVIGESGKFITDLTIGINDKQDILLTGFYADEGTVSVRGAFSMRINKGSTAISNKLYHAFDKDFIVKGLSEKAAKTVLKDIAAGDEYEQYQYSMQDLQFHDNGTFSMIAEQYVEESKIVGSGNYVSTEYRYYDDNVIVVTFKPEGDMVWKQKIAKKQFTRSVHRAYASFAYLENRNKMYFVFNEFPRDKPNKSKAVTVQLNTDGSLQREELFTAAEKKVVQPTTYKRTAEKEMCMFGLVGRNYTLAKLNFNE
jgi:hypothetical protein